MIRAFFHKNLRRRKLARAAGILQVGCGREAVKSGGWRKKTTKGTKGHEVGRVRVHDLTTRVHFGNDSQAVRKAELRGDSRAAILIKIRPVEPPQSRLGEGGSSSAVARTQLGQPRPGTERRQTGSCPPWFL